MRVLREAATPDVAAPAHFRFWHHPEMPKNPD